jgi:predicted nucleic acid-binding Zn ribbon protein
MPEYIFRCDECEIHFSITCSMSEYKAKKYVRCPKCNKKATRDLSFDNVQGSVAFSLSECKTIGHYAEKQTSQYSKDQVEEIRHNQKTKRVSSHEELPKGMSRMEKPSTTEQWTREGKTKRKPRRRK